MQILLLRAYRAPRASLKNKEKIEIIARQKDTADKVTNVANTKRLK